MDTLDEKYWSNRYQENSTGWDIGYASPPLVEYATQLDSDTQILIPGAGNAHEAVYLWEQGFKNVYVLDISEEPLRHLRDQHPQLSEGRLIHANFFEYEGPKFEVILEQTFFCALNPSLRPEYVVRMHHLLALHGKLAGVLFNIPLNQEHPPFGGHITEYKPLFEPYFHFKYFEECHNSIPPRQGSELFICLEKKQKG